MEGLYYHDECLDCRWYGIDCETGCERSDSPEQCGRFAPRIDEHEEYVDPDEEELWETRH